MHNQQMDLDQDHLEMDVSDMVCLMQYSRFKKWHLILDQADNANQQSHNMDQQSNDDDEGADDNFADPGSLYAEGLQQSRHDNEQEGLDSSDDHDENSDRLGEEDDDESSYNPIDRAQAAIQSVSQSGQSEADWLSYISRLSHLATLDSMKTAMAYIEALKMASLDDEYSKLDADTLYQLRNPPTTPVNINENPSLRLGLDLYLSVSNVSQETYTSVRKAVLR